MENGSICQIDQRLCLRYAWTERWSHNMYPEEILCLYILWNVLSIQRNFKAFSLYNLCVGLPIKDDCTEYIPFPLHLYKFSAAMHIFIEYTPLETVRVFEPSLFLILCLAMNE